MQPGNSSSVGGHCPHVVARIGLGLRLSGGEGEGDADGGLRFEVGERILARTPDGWRPGTIAQLQYREPDWPEEHKAAPYQIELDSGAPQTPVPFAPHTAIRALLTQACASPSLLPAQVTSSTHRLTRTTSCEPPQTS